MNIVCQNAICNNLKSQKILFHTEKKMVLSGKNVGIHGVIQNDDTIEHSICILGIRLCRLVPYSWKTLGRIVCYTISFVYNILLESAHKKRRFIETLTNSLFGIPMPNVLSFNNWNICLEPEIAWLRIYLHLLIIVNWRCNLPVVN